MKKLFIIFCVMVFSESLFAQVSDSLEVYPNPFKDTATVHFYIVEPDTVTIRVFSMIGAVVQIYLGNDILSSGSHDVQLIGDSLADGVYLVKLEIGTTGYLIKKVVKQSQLSIANVSKLNTDLSLFPNPVSDKLNIPIDGKKRIEIFNLMGEKVQSILTEETVLSISHLPKGMYIVIISINENEVLLRQKIEVR